MTQSRDTQQVEAALKHCASEPVHIPGAIQPHGAMIAVDNDTLCIDYASENTANLLRVPPRRLLGKRLEDVFGRKARHDMLNGMMLRETGARSADLGRLDIGTSALDVAVAAAGAHTIFEFERGPEQEVSCQKVLKDMEFLVARARGAADRQELFDRTVQMLQMLTGFDRVLIYEFDDAGNGNVVAEQAMPGLERYLGLNFPAWDIPQQARALMMQLPLRCICDVGARDRQLLSARPDLPDLDMTHATLRATSRVHVEYLRNMNKLGSMTLNIVLEGRLWGMIALHHGQPRYPSQRMRQMCRSFAEFFTLKLSGFQQAAQLERLERADALRRRVAVRQDAARSADLFETALLKDLCGIMQADGAAMLYKGTLANWGQVPRLAAIRSLLEEGAFPDMISASANLGADHPKLAEVVGPHIAGVLSASLQQDCKFLFFRIARDRVVKWAGAPDKDVQVKGGVARLSPRGSFEAYKEVVMGTSHPWSPEHMRIAEELRSVLMASEHADLIQNKNRQQALLIDELNHRVRNILALIRSLSRQSLTHNGSINSYVTALEARIAAVAAAHDLGADKSAANTSLQQIIEQEAAPYNQEICRVHLSGDDRSLRADLAPMFALVIHELMTNAVKYGGLSQEGGIVSIIVKEKADGIIIYWEEMGGPEVMEPERKGFGTTLIETSVPFELNGHLEIDYRRQGVCVEIQLPIEVLDRTMPQAEPVGEVSFGHKSRQMSRELTITGRTCLLLEDNYVVSLDTARVLEDIGFQSVQTALNVEDALAMLDSLQPGVAILDINLSAGQTSEPVALALAARGVPMVFVTGYGDTLRLGPAFADAPVLKKPVREDELRDALAELE